MSLSSWRLQDNCYTYTIEFNRNIDCWCIDDHDPQFLESVYSHVTAMPQWAQNKLAVLSMVPLVYPIEPIKGVGRRISQDRYWVFITEGEADGDNT